MSTYHEPKTRMRGRMRWMILAGLVLAIIAAVVLVLVYTGGAGGGGGGRY
jgi:hypothetical protein